MKSVQRLGVVAALMWQTGSCLAQPEPVLPALDAAAARRAQRKAQADTRDKERRESQERWRKMARATRDERWHSARDALRKRLSDAGFGPPVQEAVLDFVEEQDIAREEVRGAMARCVMATLDKTVKDSQMEKLLQDYQAVAAMARKDREAAIVQLEEATHFSTNPRLKMLLIIKGIVGDEAWMAHDAREFYWSEDELPGMYPEAYNPNPAQ